MRFRRLSLLRYGGFENRHLDFRPDSHLHVIYGPNEAGKSTALNALSDLLFGFGQRMTAQSSFRFEGKHLRIGAELVAGDGATLSFRRKRGNQKTIVSDDEGEEPLRDDVLAPFCGQLTRDIFERAFGLNSDRLERGGEAMLDSAGEIGSLLFSAASGLTQLTALRRDIEAEADRIYAPRRSQERLLYQVIDRHRLARERERDLALKSADWKRRLSEADDLQQERQAIEAARRASTEALTALERKLRLFPLIDDRRHWRDALAAYADCAAIDAVSGDRLAAALHHKQEADKALVPLMEALAERIRQRDALTLYPAALSAAGEIAHVLRLKGTDDADQRDLPGVRGQLTQLEAQLNDRARQLGFAGIEALEARLPGLVALTDLRELAQMGPQLSNRRDELVSEKERLDERADLLADAARAHPKVDPKPLRDRLEALRPEIETAGRRDALAAELAESERDLALSLSRLVPGFASLAEAMAAPVPEATVVAQAERELNQAEDRRAAAADDLARLRSALAECEAALSVEASTGEIVTASEISAARAVRDHLLGDLLADTGDRKAVLARLPSLVAEADRLADAARAHAGAIARHAELLLSREKLLAQIAAGEASLKQRDAACIEARERWLTLFRSAGIEPRPGGEMLHWLRAHGELVRRDGEAGDLRRSLAEATMAETRLRPLLTAMASPLLIPASDGLPLAALVRALSDEIHRLAEAQDASRKLAVEAEELTRRRGILDDRLQSAQQALAEWQESLNVKLAAIGLPQEATVASVLRALDLMEGVIKDLPRRDDLKRRIAGMTRNIDDFRQRVAALVERVEPAWKDQPVEVLMVALEQRQREASRNQEAHLRLTQEIANLQGQTDRLKERLAKAQEEIDAVVGARSDDPQALSLRLAQRSKIEARLREAEDRFAQELGIDDPEEAEKALQGFDRATAETARADLIQRQEEAVQKLADVSARIETARRERLALEEGPSAEQAALERASAEEEGRVLARDWVVRRLAADMLGSAMEAFRQSQGNPLIARAGGHFATLTGQRHVGLREVLDDHDRIALHAVRATGETVPVEGLSEGTRHQLYLALRLAYLEDYASRNEPPPLVCDDLFQSFDDARTASGLKALAEAAPSFQCILFTHHLSVVETAERVLGASADIIRL